MDTIDSIIRYDMNIEDKAPDWMIPGKEYFFYPIYTKRYYDEKLGYNIEKELEIVTNMRDWFHRYYLLISEFFIDENDNCLWFTKKYIKDVNPYKYIRGEILTSPEDIIAKTKLKYLTKNIYSKGWFQEYKLQKEIQKEIEKYNKKHWKQI